MKTNNNPTKRSITKLTGMNWGLTGVITIGLGVASVALIFISYRTQLDRWSLLAAGLTTTLFLFFLIVILCNAAKIFNGFSDFIIGDEGGYSLSRLQAVSWAVIIISYQVSIIILLALKNDIANLELKFSDEAMWLLGLSLSSYITVKGITVSKISKDPALYKRKTPKLRDLITGDNGLDFSKFQMLIWTIMGLFVFETNVFEYLGNISAAPPTIDPSFIVLMGLSTGAYVGKKLVPTSKLDDIKVEKQSELDELQKDVEEKEAMLQTMITTSAAHTTTAFDRDQVRNLEGEVATTRKRIQEINIELNKITEFQK